MYKKIEHTRKIKIKHEEGKENIQKTHIKLTDFIIKKN